jgi:hypothetical protein
MMAPRMEHMKILSINFQKSGLFVEMEHGGGPEVLIKV